MESLSLRANAKINLYLDVLGRLPNGYHAIETLYQSVELADTLVFEREPSETTLECDDAAIPMDDGNLIVRAARLFFRFTGIQGGVRVRLTKQIPVGGGLGGGSADAAATLVALNRLYETRYPTETLERLGSRLGADVPFCVRGGTAWGSRTGTELARTRPLREGHILLVNPGVRVETAWAYRALGMPFLPRDTAIRLTEPGKRAKIFRAWERVLAGENVDDLPPMLNRFETVVFREHCAAATVCEALRSRGAMALMSGSGATVFGVFRSEDALVSATAALRVRFAFVMPTRCVEHGVEAVNTDSEPLARISRAVS